MTINVVGAYARTYESIVSAKKDWDAGKDFRIVDGPYINKNDWVLHVNGDTVVYQGNTSTWVLQEVPV